MTVLPPKKSWFKRSPKPPASTPAGERIEQFFRQSAQQQGYTLSAGQWQVVQSLAERAGPLSAAPPAPPARSLYLYGSVGRGKSWLLDGFFKAAELSEKRRVHFHDFFVQLHQGMFRHQGRDDPLALTLDELLSDCRLLCFDEFHVHDIGDAMLITRLFKALFKRRILLIVTSNYPPEGLLPNPLYHERFLPVIRLIHSDMQVLEVGGDTDYRSLPQSRAGQQFTRGRYVWPGLDSQRQALHLPAAELAHFPLPVGTRLLRARLSEERRIRFDFADVCEEPTAVMDYLALCKRFDEWIIDHLPLLDDCSIAVQQRFINLVDVLYDQDKLVTVISQWPLTQALAANAIDLMRTRSRLGQLIEVSETPTAPGQFR
ncbi:cell division protein ZapE [Pseudomonas sp. dw_358]|uniref:cell division protein ZapE n=1 Tax=Pseudomonas sp. dw_358 TaxID=2720083 RepID=UPI001BD5ACBC